MSKVTFQILEIGFEGTKKNVQGNTIDGLPLGTN